MPTKRIIPCLDVKDGQTVKGINFENLKSAGNPKKIDKNILMKKQTSLFFWI